MNRCAYTIDTYFFFAFYDFKISDYYIIIIMTIITIIYYRNIVEIEHFIIFYIAR